MKKHIVKLTLLIVLITCFSVISYSQPANRPVDPVSQGDWVLSFSIGPGASYYSGAGSGPGFQAAFERGMWQVGPGAITLGGELGFSFFSNKVKGYYKETYFTTIVAARSAYHYGWNVRGLDTYGGLALGMRFLSYNYTWTDPYYENLYSSPASVRPHFGMFVGASYFFGPKVGINGELGYNINFAQIGVIFKLN